jgi:hypothetical protein
MRRRPIVGKAAIFFTCIERLDSETVEFSYRNVEAATSLMTTGEREIHIIWRCPWCGATLSPHAETLRRLITSRDSEPREAVPLALACPQCFRLGTYQAGHSDSNPFPIGAQRLEEPKAAQWDLVGWLKCIDATCELRLPLLARWSEATTVSERKADIAKWVWDDLVCPAWHPISSEWK